MQYKISYQVAQGCGSRVKEGEVSAIMKHCLKLNQAPYIFGRGKEGCFSFVIDSEMATEKVSEDVKMIFRCHFVNMVSDISCDQLIKFNEAKNISTGAQLSL